MPEAVVGLPTPDVVKKLPVDITKGAGGILVETAGHHIAIPGEHTGAPHAETGVGKAVFDDVTRSCIVRAAL